MEFLTNFLGYRSAEEEFKVMGLSALGNPDRFDLNDLSIDPETNIFLKLTISIYQILKLPKMNHIIAIKFFRFLE